GIFLGWGVGRMGARYGVGANVTTVATLGVASCLVAAVLEAGFLWARRGFDVLGTLGINFPLGVLDYEYPPAWQVLALGILVALAAAGRQGLRVRAASLGARHVGLGSLPLCLALLFSP